PPGRLRCDTLPAQGRCFSAYSMLLPFLEAENVYQSINFLANPDTADPLYGDVNATARFTHMGVLLCPSDSWHIMQAGCEVHNYPLCTGNTFPVSPQNPSGVPVTGVFLRIRTSASPTFATAAARQRASAKTRFRFPAWAKARRAFGTASRRKASCSPRATTTIRMGRS